jgi:hypothetical protein
MEDKLFYFTQSSSVNLWKNIKNSNPIQQSEWSFKKDTSQNNVETLTLPKSTHKIYVTLIGGGGSGSLGERRPINNDIETAIRTGNWNAFTNMYPLPGCGGGAGATVFRLPIILIQNQTTTINYKVGKGGDGLRDKKGDTLKTADQRTGKDGEDTTLVVNQRDVYGNIIKTFKVKALGGGGGGVVGNRYSRQNVYNFNPSQLSYIYDWSLGKERPIEDGVKTDVIEAQYNNEFYQYWYIRSGDDKINDPANYYSSNHFQWIAENWTKVYRTPSYSHIAFHRELDFPIGANSPSDSADNRNEYIPYNLLTHGESGITTLDYFKPYDKIVLGDMTGTKERYFGGNAEGKTAGTAEYKTFMDPGGKVSDIPSRKVRIFDVLKPENNNTFNFLYHYAPEDHYDDDRPWVGIYWYNNTRLRNHPRYYMRIGTLYQCKDRGAVYPNFESVLPAIYPGREKITIYAEGEDDIVLDHWSPEFKSLMKQYGGPVKELPQSKGKGGAFGGAGGGFIHFDDTRPSTLHGLNGGISIMNPWRLPESGKGGNPYPKQIWNMIDINNLDASGLQGAYFYWGGKGYPDADSRGGDVYISTYFIPGSGGGAVDYLHQNHRISRRKYGGDEVNFTEVLPAFTENEYTNVDTRVYDWWTENYEKYATGGKVNHMLKSENNSISKLYLTETYGKHNINFTNGGETGPREKKDLLKIFGSGGGGGKAFYFTPGSGQENPDMEPVLPETGCGSGGSASLPEDGIAVTNGVPTGSVDYYLRKMILFEQSEKYLGFHTIALVAIFGSYLAVLVLIIALNIGLSFATAGVSNTIGPSLKSSIMAGKAAYKSAMAAGEVVTSYYKFLYKLSVIIDTVEEVLSGITKFLDDIDNYLSTFKLYRGLKIFAKGVSKFMNAIFDSTLFKILTGDIGDVIVSKVFSKASKLTKVQKTILTLTDMLNEVSSEGVEGAIKIGGKLDEIGDVTKAVDDAIEASNATKAINNLVDTSVDQAEVAKQLPEITKYVQDSIAKNKAIDFESYFKKFPSTQMNDYTKAEIFNQFKQVWFNTDTFDTLANPQITDSLNSFGRLNNLEIQNVAKAEDAKPVLDFVSDSGKIKNQFSTMNLDQRKAFLDFFNNNAGAGRLNIQSGEQMESLRKVISNFDDPIYYRIVGDENTVQIMTKVQNIDLSKQFKVNEEFAKVFNNNPRLLELAKKNSTTRTMVIKSKFASGEDIIKLINSNPNEFADAFCGLMKTDQFKNGVNAVPYNREELFKLMDNLKGNKYFEDMLIRDINKLDQFSSLMAMDDVTKAQLKLKVLSNLSENPTYVNHILKSLKVDDVKALKNIGEEASRSKLFDNIKKFFDSPGNKNLLDNAGSQFRVLYEGQDITDVVDEMFNIKKSNLNDQLENANNIGDLNLVDADEGIEVVYKEKKLGDINQSNLDDLDINGLPQNEQANLFDEVSNTNLQNRVKSKQKQLTESLNAELLKTDLNDTQKIALQQAYQQKLDKCQSILDELDNIKNTPPKDKLFVNKKNPVPKLNATPEQLDNFKFDPNNKFGQKDIDGIVDAQKGVDKPIFDDIRAKTNNELDSTTKQRSAKEVELANERARVRELRAENSNIVDDNIRKQIDDAEQIVADNKKIMDENYKKAEELRQKLGMNIGYDANGKPVATLNVKKGKKEFIIEVDFSKNLDSVDPNTSLKNNFTTLQKEGKIKPEGFITSNNTVGNKILGRNNAQAILNRPGFKPLKPQIDITPLKVQLTDTQDVANDILKLKKELEFLDDKIAYLNRINKNLDDIAKYGPLKSYKVTIFKPAEVIKPSNFTPVIPQEITISRLNLGPEVIYKQIKDPTTNHEFLFKMFSDPDLPKPAPKDPPRTPRIKEPPIDPPSPVPTRSFVAPLPEVKLKDMDDWLNLNGIYKLVYFTANTASRLNKYFNTNKFSSYKKLNYTVNNLEKSINPEILLHPSVEQYNFVRACAKDVLDKKPEPNDGLRLVVYEDIFIDIFNYPIKIQKSQIDNQIIDLLMEQKRRGIYIDVEYVRNYVNYDNLNIINKINYQYILNDFQSIQNLIFSQINIVKKNFIAV